METTIEKQSQLIVKTQQHICNKSLHVCEMKFSERGVFVFSFFFGGEMKGGFWHSIKPWNEQLQSWGEKDLQWLKTGSFEPPLTAGRAIIHFATTQAERDFSS